MKIAVFSPTIRLQTDVVGSNGFLKTTISPRLSLDVLGETIVRSLSHRVGYMECSDNNQMLATYC